MQATTRAVMQRDIATGGFLGRYCSLKESMDPGTSRSHHVLGMRLLDDRRRSRPRLSSSSAIARVLCGAAVRDRLVDLHAERVGDAL